MYSEPCVLGGAPGSSPRTAAGPAQGLCAFHPATNGADDTGFCTPLVRRADRTAPDPELLVLPASPRSPATLHRGYCFAATPCPNGPSDCPSPGDAGAKPAYTCTMTTAGPLCLDTTFPLEADAGPGDAGSTDASTLDAGPGEGAARDAGPGDWPGRREVRTTRVQIDAGPVDAGPSDAGPSDAGPGDAGPGDGGSLGEDGGDGGDGG